MHPEPLHRHTPSQDSCCSNDTLFNLEELTCGINDSERDNNSPTPKISECESQYGEENIQQVPMNHNINSELNITDLSDKAIDEDKVEKDTKFDSDNSASVCKTSETAKGSTEITEVCKRSTIEFLTREREHDCSKTSEDSNSESTDHLLPFINKQVAPLPSPEDKPWKQLPASLLSYDKVISQNMLVSETVSVPIEMESAPDDANGTTSLDVNVLQNICEGSDKDENTACYENLRNLNDYYNEADYVNIVNLENTKNSAEFINNKQINSMFEDASERNSPDYVNNFTHSNDLIINNDDDDDHDIFGVLTDIRFSGPSDSQMMTTSFSESNDLNDEQDWDSGSDTRSSSSGEFIWKVRNFIFRLPKKMY